MFLFKDDEESIMLVSWMDWYADDWYHLFREQYDILFAEYSTRDDRVWFWTDLEDILCKLTEREITITGLALFLH